MKLRILVSILLSLALPSSVVAEDTPEAATETEQASPLAEGEQLLTKIGEQRDDVQELQSQFAQAKGEDRAALYEQMTRKRRESWKLIEKLYGIVLSLRESGTAAGELDKRTVEAAQTISTNLAKEITQRREALAKLRAGRDSTPPEELPTLEKQLHRGNEHLNELAQVLLKNDQYLEKLGINAESQFAFLDKMLKERAEATAGRVQLLQDEISNVKERISAVDVADAGPLNAQLSQLQKRMEGTGQSLSVAVDLMDKRGLETADYKKLLITSTGEITSDILNREVAAGLLSDWASSLKDTLIETSPRYLFKFFLFLLILFVFKMLSGFAQRLVRRALDSAKVPFSRLMQDFFLSITARAVMLLGLMIALSQLGLEIAPLLAGLGIAGFVVGFALQETLSNFASGMMILFYRPFDVGDVITAGGVSGSVFQMNLVSTTILTFDNQKLIVPNTKIWGDVITNVTAEKTRRVDMIFGIGYGDDIEHAERVLKEIVGAHELVLKTPEPVIRLHNLGESSVDFIVRPWSKTSDYWAVYWDLTREVKRRFDAEGISIPFPQRDLHVFQEQPPAPAKSAE